MFRKSNEDHFVLNQSLDRYVDSIQSSKPYTWLLVEPRFYCQDEASHTFIAKTGGSHAFIAKTRPAMLSSPRWGQPRFHMPKTRSATLLLSRRGQRYFAKTGATTLSSPGRSLPYFHCQDRGSHAFTAKTRPAMLSLPTRAATLFLPPHSWDSTEINHKDV